MHKVLCVEDEQDLREDLIEVLEDEGYEVASAANGAEALELLGVFTPDLIISDCMMPVMSGTEMLQKIRQEHAELAKVPFVFLSAHARKEQIERGMESGADAYLAKPVDYEDLLKQVEALLRSDNARDCPERPTGPKPVSEGGS